MHCRISYLLAVALVLCGLLLAHTEAGGWRPQGRFGKRTGPDDDIAADESDAPSRLADYAGKLEESQVPIFTTKHGQICVRDQNSGLYKCLQRKRSARFQ